MYINIYIFNWFLRNGSDEFDEVLYLDLLIKVDVDVNFVIIRFKQN